MRSAFAGRSPLGVVAVATRNPLDVETFSGLSARLFGAMSELGIDVCAISTRDLRPFDFVQGALNIRGFMRGNFSGRRAPKVNPDWYWSRSATEKMGRRFDQQLSRLDGCDGFPILQVGTHVKTSLPNRRSYCVTDATVVQAVAADEFSVSRARPRVIAEAIACQAAVFNACEKVFTLSEWARRSVVEDYGYPSQRVVVIGSGANVTSSVTRQVDEERPYVLFVGADWVQKGGPLVLEGFRRARKRRPNLRLKIVGCRPLLADEGGVEVIGPLSRRLPLEEHQLLRLYAGASIFSIAPRFDAFPNVLLEAGWFGVPVVTTDEGSRSEAVVSGETGLLTPSRDPEELADAMVSLIDDEALAARLGRNARVRVQDRFTWPIVGRRVATEMGVLNGAPDA